MEKSLPLQHEIIKGSSIMQKFLKAVAAIMLMTAMFCAVGCNKEDNSGNDGGENNGSNDGEVCVITYTPQDITPRTAVCGGEVVESQGLSWTELGVCWSTMPIPTVRDAHLSTMDWNTPFVCTITGLVPATIYHVRAYVKHGGSCYYGEDKSFTTESVGGTGTYIGHEFVDLGLPSGTLWATCNVGADSVEGYGDYFAWGETTTKVNEYNWGRYNWANYKYSNGDYNQLTKYCTEAEYGFNGFTDNLKTLEPSDDAAAVNWGSGWRIPTYDEWEELFRYTTNRMTTQNGVNGRLFTASNGWSLFLPATGYYQYGCDIWNIGENGHYWSSSLYTGQPYDAWYYDLKESSFEAGSLLGRSRGHSVRAVCSSR